MVASNMGSWTGAGYVTALGVKIMRVWSASERVKAGMGCQTKSVGP